LPTVRPFEPHGHELREFKQQKTEVDAACAFDEAAHQIGLARDRRAGCPDAVTVIT
jgi:hypothetical protein